MFGFLPSKSCWHHRIIRQILTQPKTTSQLPKLRLLFPSNLSIFALDSVIVNVALDAECIDIHRTYCFRRMMRTDSRFYYK